MIVGSIPRSYAQTNPVYTDPTKYVVAPPETADKAEKATSKGGDSSWGIVIWATVGTVYSGMLYNAAAEQEKESKDNVKKIDRILKTFKDSYANFCPSGRERLEEPKCYCYLENGTKNSARTNSQTCVALWAQDSYKIIANATDYSGVAQNVDVAGCLTRSGKFDEKCTCKKFVDPKGNNSCMKASGISIPVQLGSGFATGAGLGQVTNFFNGSASGNPAFNLMNPSALSANAIASKKMKEEILSKLASQLPANVLSVSKVDEKNIGQLAKAVFGEKAMQAAAQGATSAVGVAGSREADAKTNELLRAAAKNAGLDFEGSGRGLSNKKADKKDGMNFNFVGETASAGASQTQNFAEPQKNYNYKDSDISKSPDTSIFEIISNRYIQSGLKRLFEE